MGLQAAEASAEAESSTRLKQYANKKKTLAEIRGPPTEEQQARLQSLKEECKVLEEKLMETEIEFLSMTDDHITNFESQMGEIMKVLANAGKEFFQGFEEIENTFKTDLMMGLTTEMEASQAAPEASGEEAKRAKLLQDREGMMQAMASFGDAHVLLIQTKDDQMQAQLTNWMSSFFDGKHKSLLDRNRARILEIKDLVEDTSAEIETVQTPEAGGAEEEEG